MHRTLGLLKGHVLEEEEGDDLARADRLPTAMRMEKIASAQPCGVPAAQFDSNPPLLTVVRDLLPSPPKGLHGPMTLGKATSKILRSIDRENTTITPR